MNLNTWEITYADSVGKHLENIYNELYKGNVKYYQKHNTWKPAFLQYKGHTYPIELKSHGKEPNYQKIGKHISLSIKSKVKINGYKKFKLIIYERITVRGERIKILAEYFNLLFQKDKLISVKINTQDSRLYFFEVPLNKPFLDNHNLVNFKLTDQKSPILNSFSDLDSIMIELDEKLEKKHMADSTKIKIYNTYEGLNNCIQKSDTNKVIEYFNLEYIARFEAARMIGGFVNHGFTPENLLFALDTTTYKFYPILHRDHYFSTLDIPHHNQWEPYYYKGMDTVHFKLLELLFNNKSIQNTRNKILEKVISDKEKLLEQFNTSDERYSKLHTSVVKYNLFHPHEIELNIKTIEKYLDEKGN